MPATAWQRELSRAITKPEDLIDALGLDPALLAGARAANDMFALRVTPSYLARMRRGDRNDPLLRQVLPLIEETEQEKAGGVQSGRGFWLLVSSFWCRRLDLPRAALRK